jgi:hypothetical protein
MTVYEYNVYVCIIYYTHTVHITCIYHNFTTTQYHKTAGTVFLVMNIWLFETFRIQCNGIKSLMEKNVYFVVSHCMQIECELSRNSCKVKTYFLKTRMKYKLSETCRYI